MVASARAANKLLKRWTTRYLPVPCSIVGEQAYHGYMILSSRTHRNFKCEAWLDHVNHMWKASYDQSTRVFQLEGTQQQITRASLMRGE